MITKIHPTIEKRISKIFKRGWCSGVFFFTAIVVLEFFEVLDRSIAIGLAVGFALSVLVAVLYTSYLLHSIRCPDCNLPLNTHENDELQRWVAICEECKIEWNLNIGVD